MPHSLPSTSSAPVPPISDRTLVSSEDIASFSTPSPPPLVPLTAQQGNARKRSRLSTDKSRKMVTVNRMHQETLRELQVIRQSVVAVADAHKEIAGDIKRLVNFMISKE